jgi:hypothetical protein
MKLPNLTLNRACDSAHRPGSISFWSGRRKLLHAG